MKGTTRMLLAGVGVGVAAAALAAFVRFRGGPWVFVPAVTAIGIGLPIVAGVAGVYVRARFPERARAYGIAAASAWVVFLLGIVPANYAGDAVRGVMRAELLERRMALASDLIDAVEEFRVHTGTYPASLQDLRGSEQLRPVRGWLRYHRVGGGTDFELGMEDPLSDELFSGWTWRRDSGWRRWVD